MRLIDADELMEHVWRDKLDSRELIAKMVDNAPTVVKEDIIIIEAYSRANSIDAVRGFAYRNGHIREAEELDMSREMILKLINYIERREKEWNLMSNG